MCVLPQTHDAKAKPLDAQSLLIASGLLDMLVESSSAAAAAAAAAAAEEEEAEEHWE